MTAKNVSSIRREVRSPRSAAIAGIIFSIMMFVGMLLSFNINKAIPEAIDSDWLETWSGPASVVITLVPFAGIALLWFTGVIRDRLGDREDRFFATVFLGSGIITVVMLFMWGATMGAIFATLAAPVNLALDEDIYAFGFALMNEIIASYALRMAGVYMMSIGSIWTRSGVMPRWLSMVTFVVALIFLLFAGKVQEARFMFPAWVFVVSLYILILNYRMDIDQTMRRQDPIE